MYKNVEIVKPSGLDLKDRLVGVQRVTKVTKGGRAFGFSAIVMITTVRAMNSGTCLTPNSTWCARQRMDSCFSWARIDWVGTCSAEYCTAHAYH